MARITIRPDLTGTVHMVASPPAVKLADASTGLVATDRESGATLYTVQLVETYDGTAQLIKVTVPEGGVDTSLAPGSVVRPVGLVATPWANVFNGQVSNGVAYRAESLSVLSAVALPADAAVAAPKAAKS
ncbi:hypothetical protein HUT16_20435 [Kitasatospora sp. NA04385]|uniref:SCO3933 family regulatory protein n=1 Tax=Kitasatospora sp. NA04385 TaxID=2742135 RepID=UPI001591417E|nr:hypothetical protein [Kitasatospora sp. NA04385]QKW21110.1 hypothetical protein HUT16_20435 [Kitasatospora sp. NA04385]